MISRADRPSRYLDGLPVTYSCVTQGTVMSNDGGWAHKEEGALPDGKSPFFATGTGGNEALPLPLLDDYFNAAVLGTPRYGVVAGDRIAVPVARSRQVGAHAAVP